MNGKVKILIGVAAWAAIIFYFVFASGLTRERTSQIPVRSVDIMVEAERDHKFLTEEFVTEYLREYGFELPGNHDIGSVNTGEIRRVLLQNGLISDAKVYTDIDGRINIRLRQRVPVARVNTYNDYNFYIADDGYIIPSAGLSSVYVPIITGSFSLPFGRDYAGDVSVFADTAEKKVYESYLFLCKLINFVKLIRNDSFWDGQIVQIDVTERPTAGGNFHEPEVELVPRIGNHIISLGPLTDVEQKLDKLMLFYTKVLDYEGWDGYGYIDLKYKNQIVCTK